MILFAEFARNDLFVQLKPMLAKYSAKFAERRFAEAIELTEFAPG